MVSAAICMVSFGMLGLMLWGMTVAYYEDQIEQLKKSKPNQRSTLNELNERRKLYPVKIYRNQDEAIYK